MNKRDPFEKFYNVSGLDSVFITADVDWAPDFALEFFLKNIEDLGLNLTLFATHKQALLQKKRDWLEIGLHPDNTRPDKVTGLTNKISALKEFYPQSIGLRCHRNFFGQNIADLAVRAGIKYDISHVLWQKPWCQAFIDQWGLVRASYGWEDGLHCDYSLPFDLAAVDFSLPGLKVFNFHPVLFYLNSPNDNHRREATRGYADLTQAPESDLAARVWKRRGIRDFSLELLRHLKERNVKFLLCSEAFGNKAAA